MDQLIEKIANFLQNSINILGEEITVQQIATFILILIAVLIGAGYLHRWFRRLFNRLRMSHNLQNRLLAMLLLIIIIVGIGLAFRISEINTGFLGRLFHYPLSQLFQPNKKPVETLGSEEKTPIEVPEDGDHLTLARLFYAFVIVFGIFIFSNYIQWVLRRQVLQAFEIERHTQFILLRFIHFTLITIGVLIALSAVGVSFTSLAIIFGGLSIGIGFGLQNIASNLIAGFILIFERPIKIGDLVEIMELNTFGRVSSINLRSTIITALDEKEIIVPNSQLITESVHNLTHANNLFRLRIQVSVSYSSDIEVVKKALLETAHDHPEVIKEPNLEMPNVTAPFIRFTQFGESSLNFELLAWIPDSTHRFDIASDLHFMIWGKFKEYGIKIPFPQRDVHFYPTESDS
ncbi:MAG: mechanosensitive ion channel [Candidatus Poribacteria bacterium]|nr:mechanosensitive ion channel [Candidatus Poribacteria bacterium]